MSDSFFPAEFYYTIYINLCLFLVLFTLLHTRILDINSEKNVIFINISGYILLFFLIIFIGQRPIHYLFGDTVNYNVAFTRYSLGGDISKGANDYGWHLFMKFMSQIMSIHVFFTICSFVYIFPLYKLSITLFKEYWWYAFLMFVVSFSFWTYSVNGVRNGVACSLFLWGICYRNNIVLTSLFFLIGIIFHKTVLLPILAYVITFYYNDPKTYLKVWAICIPISFVLGSVFINLFASLGFGGDDRLAGYLTSTSSNSGFRWDFIFYSAFPVFAGWYYVFKRNFDDKIYNQLLNTYLICNSFWILVIRANFSNRFAYLSWFMMAIVIIYPLFKQSFFKDQHVMIGNIVAAYFSFTYAMSYLYY